MAEQATEVTLEIGVNGAFLTRRWEEPDNWMRLTKECGFPLHSFCADVLDPFFSGDKEYQLDTARAVWAAANRHGVEIWDNYTGVATHRFHGLSHSNASVRERMHQWIEECAVLCEAMHCPRLGGHWDAFSVEVLADPVRTEAAWRNIIGQFRDLAQVCKSAGLEALYNEQMYIPSEVPWTLEQAERFLVEVNANNNGVPVRLALDTGHAAGVHYGLEGPSTDYLEWLRRFGAVTDIIHLQQTTPDASHHWPFTEDYNRRGGVDIAAVIEALKESHRRYGESAVAGVLDRCTRVGLIAEIIPGSTKTEEKLLAELTESARYLRGFIPAGGLTFTVD
jgi:D-erythrulose 1-phosphate 3-epimerase